LRLVSHMLVSMGTDPSAERRRLTLTIEETARLIGIGRGLAYEAAARGDLPGVIRIGHRLVVARGPLEAWLGVPLEPGGCDPE
jgi:predicted DNA-binding transcriptional regulator AlpA